MRIKRLAVVASLLLAFAVLAYPLTAGAVVNWTKDADPVLVGGGMGAWDENIERAMVMKDGTTFKMWYTGVRTDMVSGVTDAARIGYATATEGTPWTKYGSNPVLLPGAPGAWDDKAVGYAWVIKMESGTSPYKMWYTGTDQPEFGPGLQIGYAESPDGINWTKYPSPVLQKGGIWDWDGDGIGGPTVIYDLEEPDASKRFKMWYVGFSEAWPEPGNAIGYAYSPDGINWTKYNNDGTTADPFIASDPVIRRGTPGSWDADEFGTPSVIKDGIYRMWYSGAVGEDPLDSIGYAYSVDGINWTKYDGNPVMSKGPNAFDQDDIYDPMVVKEGNTYHMFYVGASCSGPYCTDTLGYASSNAYSGPSPSFENVMVNTLHMSTGKSISFSLVPQGPGPLDIDELYVTGDNGVFLIFRDSNINDIVGMTIVGGGISGVTDFAPYAGNYTFTITANNRATASKVLNFSSPAEIPYPQDGVNGFQRYIELGGNTYPTDNAYISGTTPILKWSPMTGYENYYYRVRVWDLKRVRCWFQSGLIQGTGGLMSASVPQGILQPNTPYQYEIEALDTDNVWSAHNRSRSTAWKFYTGTRGTSDFLPPNGNVFHFSSFNAGDRTIFAMNVNELAPWDIVSGVSGFRVERSGTTEAYIFNFGSPNFQDLNYYLYAPVDYSDNSPTLVGIPPNGTYTFTISDGSATDTATKVFADNPSVPQVTRESMLPVDNSYLPTLEPTLSWNSGEAGYRYRVRINNWRNFSIWVSSWTNGTGAGTPMSVTVPAGILQGGPYRWFVEVQDAGNNTRTRSQFLTLNAGATMGSAVKDGIACDFGDIYGLWHWDQLGGWSQLNTAKPGFMVPADVDNDGTDELVATFSGYGLWYFDQTLGWKFLDSAIPDVVVPFGGGGFVASYASIGMWRYDTTSGWVQINSTPSSLMTPADVDNDGTDELVATFSGYGLWYFDQTLGWKFLDSAIPDRVIRLGGSGFVATYATIGLWHYDTASGWAQWDASSPSTMAAANIDNSGPEEFIGGFGSYGLWYFSQTTGWHQINPDAPGGTVPINLFN